MARHERSPAIGRRFSPDRQASRMSGRRVSAPAHAPELPAAVTVDSLDGQQRRRLCPEIFQPIELPLILGEYVDQYVPEVKDDPAARRAPLDTLGTKAGFGHSLGDGAIDGAQLTLVGTGRNDE